ncbi:hypothetical protein HDC36_003402 [Xanthomonas sp. JAI131]|uniref:hypothetical protein n=1 Tax=Xanthomonas sp. JAI131 TaxID=2723067 RepID=UPI0015CB2C06|nr:hypothetical protein [Xanthomonas sp. JAI131]NYF21926.1 hypothetical protein [Xanthomonas sp. JAI131]
MSLTTAQTEAAIEAASRIVVAMIETSPAFRNTGDAAKDSAAAANAFKQVFEQIKASAS